MQTTVTQHIATQKIRRRKPARRLSSARVFTFVNKKPPSPTLFSAQKTGKSALDSHKNAYFCGGRRLHRRGQNRGAAVAIALFFVVLVAHVVSCQIVLNIIKISNKSCFAQTLFIIFAVFNRIEHDHIIEQAKKGIVIRCTCCLCCFPSLSRLNRNKKFRPGTLFYGKRGGF